MLKKDIYIDFQFSKEDVYSLVYLLGCVENPKIVVELGCWYGASTIAIGYFLKNLNTKFYTIDNFSGDGSSLKEKIDGGVDFLDTPKNILNHNLKLANLSNSVNVLDGDSSDMAKKFEDNSVDFIFIDADHRYSGIKKDILSWYPKVKEDGIFCGHDFEQFEYSENHIEEDFSDAVHHGVIKATQEIFPRVNWLPDKIWWACKKSSRMWCHRVPSMSFIDKFNYNSPLQYKTMES